MSSAILNNIRFSDLPEYIKISIFILALLLPGFGFLFITNQELLVSFQPIQLILAVLLYSLPIYFLWSMTSLLESGLKADTMSIILISSIKTIFFFYASIAIYTVIPVDSKYQIKDEYSFYGITVFFVFLDILDIYKNKKSFHIKNKVLDKS